MLSKLKLLMHLNLHLDIWTTFKKLTILTLKAWSIVFIHPLQLSKANTADTEAPLFDLHLSISNGFVSSKIYHKCNDFDFDVANFPFLDGDVPHPTS